MNVNLFFIHFGGRDRFPHERTHTVENPKSHQMTLDYFYGQSGEYLSGKHRSRCLYCPRRHRCGGCPARRSAPFPKKISSSQRIFCSEKFRSETLKNIHTSPPETFLFFAMLFCGETWYPESDNSEFGGHWK